MKKTHYRWWIGALLFGAGMLNYLDRAALSVVAPIIKRELGIDDAQMGILFSSFFIAYCVFCFVGGWAAGGGHSLHVVADLTIASRQHARFMQTDANVGSFDAGYGSAYLARQVGQKRAREIFFLAREYSAEQALAWGAVNDVVDHDRLEDAALEYARIIATKSPQAIRMLKFAFNLADDGLAGQQVFAGEATRLAYMTDEAVEGRDAFLEHRDPDWSGFPYAF